MFKYNLKAKGLMVTLEIGGKIWKLCLHCTIAVYNEKTIANLHAGVKVC